MKKLFIPLMVILSPITFANNNCTKWENKPDYVKAIEVVANNEGYTYSEICQLPKIWDIEAQPSRIILRDGTVIPHVRIQLHMEYSSCLFMVNRQNWAITEQRCYSGS